MITQYGIYFKETPSKIFEVIRAGDEVIEDCPVFYYKGSDFPCEDYGVRELTEREIKRIVLLKSSESHLSRKEKEYNEWVIENDKNESLGNPFFYLRGNLFYTINREEFKKLKDQEISKGNMSFEYRGETFSVFHFC